MENAPDGKAPTFVVRALRDVDGANLDRVQMVKGWMDGQGKLREGAFYDVLCSDDRQITGEHRCGRPVGNTVDVAKATYTNSMGDALMMAHWQDPAFDPRQRAFYLRARAGDSDTPLEHLRRGLLWRCVARGH